MFPQSKNLFSPHKFRVLFSFGGEGVLTEYFSWICGFHNAVDCKERNETHSWPSTICQTRSQSNCWTIKLLQRALREIVYTLYGKSVGEGACFPRKCINHASSITGFLLQASPPPPPNIFSSRKPVSLISLSSGKDGRHSTFIKIVI